MDTGKMQHFRNRSPIRTIAINCLPEIPGELVQFLKIPPPRVVTHLRRRIEIP